MAVQLSSGEFSTMTRLSRKALRLYQEQGLLEPARVDPSTGYRFYDVSQVETAQLIRRFRELDMPVAQIKAVLAAPSPAARTRLISRHLRHMEEQLDRTRETIGELRALLVREPTPLEVRFRSALATRAAAISDTVRTGEVGQWWSGALREIHASLGGSPTGPPGGLYATELFTEEVGGATVFVPTDAPVDTSGRVRVIEVPSADLAVTTHAGSHSGIDRTYGALGSYVAERELGAEGPVRENYLFREGGEMDTEVCWPVHHETES
ncbi:MerR family transcriptional regulator [Kutzneria viridogrisea]|uniref:HTH merR-type domain-containing protein n=2 Tax=Kutzneria TaxID=43356 RepID=W5WF39_9PSEU|nr:MerR family transcriptional regulator [Kutzneria albida]AHH99818.1 hypothetical protein KALB_6459 [Kutzneria albida DSM 43870]MBA8924994.1 DNA-binding transcriptional MerR regulator/effector-binding domain-containing protein [Kutzneria viridogrisea]